MTPAIPPVPPHPEPHSMTWTALEREYIEAYGRACWETAMAPLPPAQAEPGRVEELARWLDAKWARHGEIEDRDAAQMLRALAASPPVPAPAVEPAAWGNGDELNNMHGRPITVADKPDGWRKTPLYASPPVPQADAQGVPACDAKHCAVTDAMRCKSGACRWNLAVRADDLRPCLESLRELLTGDTHWAPAVRNQAAILINDTLRALAAIGAKP